ncbi:hypothetical protein K3495_g4215 [Podosphaera aphanis]|nr:hypothetical protein K3495_g4215 [Podosphaera aphanis]
MTLQELTLIVAATNRMGIGKAGTLPWTGLKKEMAYFAHVTKRAESPATPNAVIMGRKTWDSIPARFQPLKDRTNIVVTRCSEATSPTNRVVVGSVDDAVCAAAGAGVGRTFVIGGGQIYAAALAIPAARRILLTRVLSDFECDTFFPLALGADGHAEKWERKSPEELDAWTGLTVPKDVQVENGVRYTFEMWERID